MGRDRNRANGDAAETILDMSYTIAGMQLIHSDQEYDLDHQLKFFERDNIPKTKGNMSPLLVKLGEFKNNDKALQGAKQASTYMGLSTSDDASILAFELEKDGELLIFLANLSDEPRSFYGLYDLGTLRIEP